MEGQWWVRNVRFLLEGASGIWNEYLDTFCLIAWLHVVYVDNCLHIAKSFKTKWNKISSILNRKESLPLEDTRLLDALHTDLGCSQAKRATLKWQLYELQCSIQVKIKNVTFVYRYSWPHFLSVEVVCSHWKQFRRLPTIPQPKEKHC